MDNTQKSPTVLSLCTGYGGIEAGIEKAIGPVQTLAHVEIEAFADTNLVNKMETGKLDPVPIFTNIKTFRPYIFRDKVDILTGGYPCQPFSAAGKRKGKDDPRHLWPWVRETIKAVRPGLCFFENVEGHISLGLREVLTDLVKLGYSVENDCGEPTWGLFSAAEVGAPHQRKRVFILAYSERSRAGEYVADGSDINGQIEQVGEENQISVTGSSKTRLAQPTSESEQGCQGRTVCQRRYQTEAGQTGVVANPRSPKPNRIPESKEWQQNRETGDSGIDLEHSGLLGQEKQKEQTAGIEQSSEELAKPIVKRSQRSSKKQNEQKRLQITFRRSDNSLWPARPGQEQYKWEEPRTVVDSEEQRLQGCGKSHIEDRREPEKNRRKIFNRTSNTQFKLGRTIDGNKDRVDRLRLCGNGVVPATAEKAFITLMNRILNPGPVQPSIQLEIF